MMKKLIQFFNEAYLELKKVTWLGKKEMIASTWVIIILVIVMAMFISAIDFVLSRVIGFFI